MLSFLRLLKLHKLAACKLDLVSQCVRWIKLTPEYPFKHYCRLDRGALHVKTPEQQVGHHLLSLTSRGENTVHLVVLSITTCDTLDSAGRR